MTKRYVDQQIALSATFQNDSLVNTDPTEVTFTYRMGRDGTDTDVTPTNPSVGKYTATFTPDKSGQLYGFFKGTGALIKTIPVNVPIHPKQLPVG